MDIKFSEVYFKIIPPITFHIVCHFHIFIHKNILALKPSSKICITCMQSSENVKAVSNDIEVFHNQYMG